MTGTAAHGATGSQYGGTAPQDDDAPQGDWVMVSDSVAVNLARAASIEIDRTYGTATVYYDSSLRQSLRCEHRAGSLNVWLWMQEKARPLPTDLRAAMDAAALHGTATGTDASADEEGDPA